jgi:hypothetical protein
MVKDFVIGLVQGGLIALLLSTFDFGFFGLTGTLIGNSLGLNSFLENVVIYSIVNVAFYFLFSSKAIKGHQMQFTLGLVVGVLIL